MRKVLFLLLGVLLLAGEAFAQSRTIKGKVTSADDGQPVIGAAVQVKGTSTGAVTNPDGDFTIQVPDGATTLVFRSIGMKELEVALKESNTVNVVLQQDVTRLTETVVTANAIRRDKSSLGYAAPTLKNEDLTKAQVSSPLNALAGKVAGVNISSTAGAPGSSSRIVIRGGSSIAGNNQALMVVDGIPIDNSGIVGNSNSRTGGTDARSSIDFGNRGNDINPDDIESVTVLKGPAAAALYGSRASNGALIITTKTGKKLQGKKNEVTLNSSVTFSNILKLPTFQNEFGQGGDGHEDPKENWSWGARFDGQEKEWGQSINGVRLKKPYVALQDNVRDFFELGKAYNNNVSLSGAGEKTTYYLSLNSLNANGVMPGSYDKYNKYGVRFNGTAQLNNKFTTSVSVNYSKINSDLVQGGQGPGSVYDNVIQTPRDIPLDKMGDLTNPYYSMGGLFDPQGNEQYGYYGAYTTSPYFILQNYRNINDVDRVTGNFTITYKPLEWLDITERLGGDIYSDRRQYKYPKYSVIPADDAGNYSADNLNQSTGKYGLDQYNLSEITHDLMVTGRKQFNPDFGASLMVGHNVRMRSFNILETQTNQANGLVIPGWYSLDNSNGPVYTYDERLTRRLVGLYGELNLDYKRMLYIGFTARNDWSSTLPEGNNSFFYPSVNGSFVFTELLQNTRISRILNYGKLRASWAQVGNDADPYLLRSYYRRTDIAGGFGNTTFPFNGIPGYTVDNRIGNANLKPEITTAFEVGTELNFFENRLSVDFSYYRNRSKDQILPVPIAPGTGYAFKVLNTGLVENKGVELSLRGTPIRTASGFTLELFGTYTKNDNTVLDIAGGVDQVVLGGVSGMSIVAAKGRPYGTFYAQDIKRDPQGNVIINPVDGMPMLTDQAVYLGSYNPDYMASAGANMSYKGFSFGILFDTKQGNKFYSRTKDIMDFVGTAPETTVGGREAQIWANSVYESEPGKFTPNTQYTYLPQDWFTNSIPPGQHIVDGSYVRLREASLSYRLPRHLLNRTPFGDVTVGIFGNNLALWTADENVYADPEVNSGGSSNQQGFDFTAQPSLRNFGANVKVTF